MKKILCFIILAMALLVLPSSDTYADVFVETDNISDVKKALKECIETGDLICEIKWTATMAVDRSDLYEECDALVNDFNNAYMKVGISKGYLVTGIGSSYSISSGVTNSLKFRIGARSLEKVTICKNEKDAYKKAVKALKKMDLTTRFVAKDGTDYTSLFMRALMQHPEYDYGLGVTFTTYEDFTVFNYSNYSWASEIKKVKKKMKKADAKAEEIVKAVIKSGMTETEKANAIHNHIINNCYYDMETVKNKDYTSNAYNAYGALIEGKAVCQGYAAAFNLCAQKAGLNSISVSGYGNGGAHAWNYVCLDGKYSYIDVTWDDPVGYKGSSVRQDYFCISKEKLLKDHRFDETLFSSKYITYSKFLAA